MTKRKILFDAGPLIHSNKTGVGFYLTGLLNGLSAEKPAEYDFVGYYFNFLGKNKFPFDTPSFEHNPIRIIPGKVLSLCRKIGFQIPLGLLVHRKSDVVLFTNYASLPTSGTKKVVFIYDLSFLDCPEFLGEKNLKFLEKFCPQSICGADLIVTISEHTKERIKHYFPNIKAEIVVTPIPPVFNSQTSYDLSKRLKKLAIIKERYILYLGTIEPRKNLENLIQAYQLLPNELKEEYSLVLAGGKGWRDEEILQKIQQLQNIGLKIIQTGYVNDEERSALYSNAACFVFPSHYEGFGMPIFEAMQYGLPVAVSDIPVFREAAGDAVTYFDKDNPQNMANVIEKVVTNPSLQAKLANAGSVQLAKFSWEQNAKTVLRAIDKLFVS